MDEYRKLKANKKPIQGGSLLDTDSSIIDSDNLGQHQPELGIYDTRHFEVQYKKFIDGKNVSQLPKHPDPEVTYDHDNEEYFWNGKEFDPVEYENYRSKLIEYSTKN